MPRRRRTPEGWAAWIVVAAALVPLVVVLASAAALLTGAADDTFFVEHSTDENGVETRTTQADVTFWQRWGFFWLLYPAGGGLLAVAALVVVLAVLQFARRPRWLVPGRAARRAGAAVGAVTSLSALVLVAVALVASRRTPAEGERLWYTSGSVVYDVGNLGVPVVVAAVLAGLAAAALVHPGPVPTVTLPAAGGPEPVTPDPTAPGPTAPDAAAPGPAAPAPPAVVAGAERSSGPPPAVSFPRPADPALYRRPRS